MQKAAAGVAYVRFGFFGAYSGAYAYGPRLRPIADANTFIQGEETPDVNENM